MWNLKYGTNEPVYKSETGSYLENRLVVAKGEGDDAYLILSILHIFYNAFCFYCNKIYINRNTTILTTQCTVQQH